MSCYVKNLNPDFGDAILFDSFEEYETAVKELCKQWAVKCLNS
jgi:hypothetical protein